MDSYHSQRKNTILAGASRLTQESLKRGTLHGNVSDRVVDSRATMDIALRETLGQVSAP
ncbi:unnamed protein product, partial [Amoebophrya sp. A25]|eukprot:GSA25T00000390001.1